MCVAVQFENIQLITLFTQDEQWPELGSLDSGSERGSGNEIVEWQRHTEDVTHGQ
jgi:hypothetical protein